MHYGRSTSLLASAAASITIDGLRRLSKRQCVILWFRAPLKFSRIENVSRLATHSFSLLSPFSVCFVSPLCCFSLCDRGWPTVERGHAGVSRWSCPPCLCTCEQQQCVRSPRERPTRGERGEEFAGKQRGDLCRCGTMGPLLQRCKSLESLQTDLLSLSLSLFLSFSLSLASLVLLDRPLFFPRCPVLIPRCTFVLATLCRRSSRAVGFWLPSVYGYFWD